MADKPALLYARIPPDIHARAVKAAAADRRSLNSFLICALEQYLRRSPAGAPASGKDLEVEPSR